MIKKSLAKNKNTGLCKTCKSEMDKTYREKNKEKISQYFKKLWQNPERRSKNRRFKEIKRFGLFEGGLTASEYLVNKNCEKCGITNEQHKEKFGTRLHIHHKDEKGRNFTDKGLEPNNSQENLMIVCNSCHGAVGKNFDRIDSKTRMAKAWRTRRVKVNKNNNLTCHGMPL